MKRIHLLFIGSILLLASCTIQKRIYSSGYYIDWRVNTNILCDSKANVRCKNDPIVISKTNEDLEPKANDQITSKTKIYSGKHDNKILPQLLKQPLMNKSPQGHSIIFKRTQFVSTNSSKNKETNKNIFGILSVSAVVLGILMLISRLYAVFIILILAAIVLGIIGLTQVKRTKDDKKEKGSRGILGLLGSILGIIAGLVILGGLYWIIFVFSGG